MAKKPYIIALEEHYQDPEVKALGGGPGAGRTLARAPTAAVRTAVRIR